MAPLCCCLVIFISISYFYLYQLSVKSLKIKLWQLYSFRWVSSFGLKLKKILWLSNQFYQFIPPLLREPKKGSCKTNKKIYWRVTLSYKNEPSSLYCYYFVLFSRLLFSEIIFICDTGGNFICLLSSSKCWLPTLSHIAIS